MKTPSLQEFKRWAKSHYSIARAVIMAQAFAQLERERVDAYIQPLFDLYDFRVRAEWADCRPDEKITKPKDLYLSNQEALIAEYYEECDKEHRKHGFTGPHGHCPALRAENLQIIAENLLLDAGCKWLDISRAAMGLDDRKKMLDLLLGACLKDAEKVAA